MEKKHLYIALGVVVALMVLSTVGMDHLWGKVLDYSPYLEENWDVVLPEKAKCDTLYGVDESELNLSYHVITCKEASYFETMLPWSEIDEDTKETAKGWLEEMKQTEEVCPDWENCRVWQKDREDGSQLFFFWDQDRILLHVLEHFA